MLVRSYSLMAGRLMLLAGLCALLCACGSVEVRPAAGSAWKLEAHATTPEPVRAALAQAADCCGSLAALPYQELAQGGKLGLRIGLDAPAHRFETGKSFFAAYRVAGLPRPARIELTSYRSAEPGSLLQTAMPDARQTVFQPTVLLLNEAFEVVRRVEAGPPRAECVNHWAGPAFSTSVLLTESAREVAYLVLLTSAESLQREGLTVCGLVRHGMSPVGELELRTRTLPADDLPLRLVAPVTWYPDARRREDVGLWQFMVAEPRLLALGAQALHILAPEATRYRPVHRIPYARIARAATDASPGPSARYFSLTALEPGAAAGAAPALRHHSFDLAAAEAAGSPPADQLAALLAERIAPGLATQTIAWRVRPEAPEMSVEGSMGSRIGQAAAAGGMVTALPCGLCQTGACPPEALGTCAALFSVGALLGGTAEVIKEMFTPAQTPDARVEMQALGGRAPVLAPVRLEQCLGSEMAGTRQTPWVDQGLSARSLLLPRPAGAGAPDGAGAADGHDYLAEVLVRELTLAPVPRAKGGAAQDSWWLHIEAQLGLTERASGHRVTRRVEWSSPAQPSAAWTQQDSPLLPEVASQACTQLARQLLQAAETAWRGR